MISEFVVVGAPVSVDLNHKSRRNVVGVEINPYIFDNVYNISPDVALTLSKFDTFVNE